MLRFSSVVKTLHWQAIPVWSLVIVCFVMALLAHIRIPETLIDDAFITYRYAANLASGRGLVYNPGQHVLGTTTPGYALLLGTIASVVGPSAIPVISRVVNFIALVLMAAIAGLMGKRVTGNTMSGGAIFAIILTAPAILLSSVSGMESVVFLALTSLAMLAFFDQKWRTFAILAGFLPLFRPEGVFFMGLAGLGLLIGYLAKRGPVLSFRTLIEIGGLMILPGAVWGIIAWVYYGSPVPLSIVAKQHGLYPLTIEHSIAKVIDGIARNTPFRNDSSTGITVLAIGSLVIVMYLWGSIWLAHRSSLLLLMSAFGFSLIVFYATSATVVFIHYLAHFEVPLKLCLWASLYAILSWPISRYAGKETRKHLLTLIGGTTALMVLMPAFLSYPWNSVRQNRIDTTEIDQTVLRQEMYRSLARELNPQIPPDTVVLMPEIGELGFYLENARVLDACGLVSPETLAYLPVPYSQQVGILGVIPRDLVQDYRPDLIITMENFGRLSIWKDPVFWDNYVAVIVWRGDSLPWGNKGLYVFSRKDFEPGLRLRATNRP